MDVHLDLSMTQMRPLDGLNNSEYPAEFGDIFKSLEKRLDPLLINEDQWKRKAHNIPRVIKARFAWTLNVVHRTPVKRHLYMKYLLLNPRTPNNRHQHLMRLQKCSSWLSYTAINESRSPNRNRAYECWHEEAGQG